MTPDKKLTRPIFFAIRLLPEASRQRARELSATIQTLPWERCAEANSNGRRFPQTGLVRAVRENVDGKIPWQTGLPLSQIRRAEAGAAAGGLVGRGSRAPTRQRYGQRERTVSRKRARRRPVSRRCRQWIDTAGPAARRQMDARDRRVSESIPGHVFQAAAF